MMKLSKELGLSPEQKEQLLEELLAEKTVLNVKSFVRLSTINMRLVKVMRSLADLPADKFENAFEMILPEMEKVEELIRGGK